MSYISLPGRSKKLLRCFLTVFIGSLAFNPANAEAQPQVPKIPLPDRSQDVIRLTLSGPATFKPGNAVNLRGRLAYIDSDLGIPFQEIELELTTNAANNLHGDLGYNAPQTIRSYRTLTDQNGDFTARPRLTEPFHYEVVALWGTRTYLAYDPTIEIGPDPTKFLESEMLRLSPLVTVAIEISGSGIGSVSSDPALFSCTGLCTRDVVLGTQLNLTPSLGDDSAFLGWSSNCPAAQRTCRITIEQTSTVTARFEKSFKQLSAGREHVCGLMSSGTVKCWGSNSSGQLGANGAQPGAPGLVSNLSGVVAVAAGDLHTCALIFSGTVKCWGQGPRANLEVAGYRAARTQFK